MVRVLVIEDDPDVRTILCRVLINAGYEVVEAGDGRAGLRLCQEHAVDLVLTDIFMPEQDGFETLRALQTLTPPVKIIAISGGGSMGNVELLTQATRLGAHRALQKPVMREELLAVVQEVLAED